MRRKLDTITPATIKFAAVFTAMPRWVLALLFADGLVLPPEWDWVHWVSGLFGIGMCVLEGVAVAYVLSAITKGKSSRALKVMVVLMLGSFIGVLAPSIYARTTGVAIADVLIPSVLWGWSACVAASTIFTVAATGLAQAAFEGATEQSVVAQAHQAGVRQGRAELQEAVNNANDIVDYWQAKVQQLQAEWQAERDQLLETIEHAQPVATELQQLKEHCRNLTDQLQAKTQLVEQLQTEAEQLDPVNGEGVAAKERYIELVAKSDGNLSDVVAARILDVSRSYVQRIRTQLVADGVLYENGNGLRVVKDNAI